MNPLLSQAYLITVPHGVPPSSDGETSDGEESDGTFSVGEFEEPPFEIDWTKRGEIRESDKLRSSHEIPYVSEFINKVENESFGKDRAQVKERVAVVIGHNRMRSLSSSVNRLLVEQSKKFAQGSVLSREIHFFWRPQWKNINTGVKVEWEKVRKFYRQLKNYNRQIAILFRNECEGLTQETKRALELFYDFYKNSKINSKTVFSQQQEISYFTQRHIKVFEGMLKKKTVRTLKKYIKLILKKVRIIPYREFREEIKNHPQTKECINRLRNGTRRPIYTAIQDSDLVSMQNLFSNYDQALQAHFKKHGNLPDVASGGYKIEEPRNPILEVAVLIDLWIRHCTAEFFPRGVYYPEPNTLVRIKEGESSLEASFLDRGDYSSPHEMPILIADLIKKRKIINENKHLKKRFLFDAHAALTTATAERMERNFKAFYNKQNKIVRWGINDLKTYKGIAQSHYKNRSWAINLCEAIGVPEDVVYENTTIIRKDLRNLVISLVARLFSTYDPFEIARRAFDNAERKKVGFQQTMIAVLNNYAPDDLQPYEERKYKKDKGDLTKIWKKIDAIHRQRKLLSTIDKFLEQRGKGQEILEAAKSSMQKVVEIFREKLSLNFMELSIAAMMSFEKPRDFKEQENHSIIDITEIGSPLHQTVLQMVDINLGRQGEIEQISKKLTTAVDRKGYLETHPMHWAAITGNTEAVRVLKSCNGWISLINQEGERGLLPLHCAIRYCADNGNDLHLIQELVSNQLELTPWEASEDLRESPLAMALNELDDPFGVVEILSEYSILAVDNQEALLTALREFKPAKHQKSMLLFLIDTVPTEKTNSLIKELLQQGLKFDDNILSKALKKLLNQETFNSELCLALLEKCSLNKDNWHLFQLPCGHTFLEHILDGEHSDAAKFLVNHFRNFDKLNQGETQQLRELTGDKTVMCKEDRKLNKDNAYRRAVKEDANDCRDISGLEEPEARKVFSEYNVDFFIESGELELSNFENSDYDSYDTSSFGEFS